jgi:mono/diheme cytochrome c family protein
MSRFGWFIFGVIAACVGLVIGAFLYVKLGGVQMAVNAPMQPFEKTVAKMALHASFASSLDLISPVPVNDDTLTAGAKIFKDHCADCHGLPGKPSAMAKQWFPPPPQLLETNEMCTDDSVGETYWKVSNGIRLTAMPEFKSALSQTERWQVTLFLKYADKLPSSALAVLNAAPADAQETQATLPAH